MTTSNSVKVTTRRKIMDAAVHLFAQHGVAEATTRAIADTARVAEGSIYRYFSCKEDLAWQIFRDYHEHLAAILLEKADQQKALPQKIMAMVEQFYTEADKDWTAFSYYLTGQQSYVTRIDNESLHPYSVVCSVIDQAIRNKELQSSNSKLLGAMAMGAVQQIALNKLYGRYSGSLKKMSEPVSKAVYVLISSGQV